MERRLKITRIVLDILCLIVVYIPWLCIITLPKPYRRGFFCNDESLSHPYKDSTISTLVLSIVGVGLPIITILITEAVHSAANKRKRIPENAFYIGDKSFPAFTYRSYKVIGSFLFGLAVTMVITDVIKYSVGRLRPHFFDVCKPDYSKFACTDSLGHPLYIEDDVCTGTGDKKLKEMRVSFPSGHASISIYTMLFAVYFLHTRFNWKGAKLLGPLMEFVYIMMAVYTCCSRVSDYKHHWSDVLGGAVIGAFIASLTVLRLSDLCRRRQNPYQEDLESVRVTPSRQASRVTYLTDNPSPHNANSPASPFPYTYNNQPISMISSDHPDLRNHSKNNNYDLHRQ